MREVIRNIYCDQRQNVILKVMCICTCNHLSSKHFGQSYLLKCEFQKGSEGDYSSTDIDLYESVIDYYFNICRFLFQVTPGHSETFCSLKKPHGESITNVNW